MGDNENEKVRVKFYLMLRQARGLPDVAGTVTKQWALLIAYYEKDEEGNEKEYEQEIVEVWNKEGLIDVTVNTYSRKPRKDWESAIGYKKQSLHNGFHELPSDRFAEDYAEEYMRSNKRFDLFDNNCQTFMAEFLKRAATAQGNQMRDLQR